jgi:hypothetical protein
MVEEKEEQLLSSVRLESAFLSKLDGAYEIFNKQTVTMKKH